MVSATTRVAVVHWPAVILPVVFPLPGNRAILSPAAAAAAAAASPLLAVRLCAWARPVAATAASVRCACFGAALLLGAVLPPVLRAVLGGAAAVQRRCAGWQTAVAALAAAKVSVFVRAPWLSSCCGWAAMSTPLPCRSSDCTNMKALVFTCETFHVS